MNTNEHQELTTFMVNLVLPNGFLSFLYHAVYIMFFDILLAGTRIIDSGDLVLGFITVFGAFTTIILTRILQKLNRWFSDKSTSRWSNPPTWIGVALAAGVYAAWAFLIAFTVDMASWLTMREFITIILTIVVIYAYPFYGPRPVSDT